MIKKYKLDANCEVLEATELAEADVILIRYTTQAAYTKTGKPRINHLVLVQSKGGRLYDVLKLGTLAKAIDYYNKTIKKLNNT